MGVPKMKKTPKFRYFFHRVKKFFGKIAYENSHVGILNFNGKIHFCGGKIKNDDKINFFNGMSRTSYLVLGTGRTTTRNELTRPRVIFDVKVK